ncbi:MAG: hypothetical protein HOP24_09490, partial [Sideroxydans sp.]|nr:hypothetical protein [Sideroxydans sp.]
MFQITNPIKIKLSRHLSYKRQGLYSVLFFSLIGFLLSVTQFFGESPDYFNYESFFDLVRSQGMNILEVSRFEPGFSIFAVYLTHLFTSNVIVYSWIVATAMLLKGWVINVHTTNLKIFLLIAVFYVVRYFPLHELTQLRAAIAIALVMVGAMFVWQGKLLQGLLICVMAPFFQMSVAIIIPALLLSVSKRWLAILIVSVAFILTSIFTGVVTGYLGDYIKILDAYQNQGFFDEKPNPFAFQLLIDWGMIIVALVMWNKLTLLMKRIILIELIGMAIFYGGIEFGVIAHRIRELYSVFWVFFIADGLRLKATKVLCFGFVLICVL